MKKTILKLLEYILALIIIILSILSIKWGVKNFKYQIINDIRPKHVKIRPYRKIYVLRLFYP